VLLVLPSLFQTGKKNHLALIPVRFSTLKKKDKESVVMKKLYSVLPVVFAVDFTPLSTLFKQAAIGKILLHGV